MKLRISIAMVFVAICAAGCKHIEDSKVASTAVPVETAWLQNWLVRLEGVRSQTEGLGIGSIASLYSTVGQGRTAAVSEPNSTTPVKPITSISPAAQVRVEAIQAKIKANSDILTTHALELVRRFDRRVQPADITLSLDITDGMIDSQELAVRNSIAFLTNDLSKAIKTYALAITTAPQFPDEFSEGPEYAALQTTLTKAVGGIAAIISVYQSDWVTKNVRTWELCGVATHDRCHVEPSRAYILRTPAEKPCAATSKPDCADEYSAIFALINRFYQLPERCSNCEQIYGQIEKHAQPLTFKITAAEGISYSAEKNILQIGINQAGTPDVALGQIQVAVGLQVAPPPPPPKPVIDCAKLTEIYQGEQADRCCSRLNRVDCLYGIGKSNCFAGSYNSDTCESKGSTNCAIWNNRSDYCKEMYKCYWNEGEFNRGLGRYENRGCHNR